MKTILRLIIAVICIVCFSGALIAQEKLSKVRIDAPLSKNARAQLLGLLQIDHFNVLPDGSIDAEISQSDLQRLQLTPYSYEVIIPDMSKYLDSVNAIYFHSRKKHNQLKVAFDQSDKYLEDLIPTPSSFEVKSGFGGYYSFSEMEEAMDNLVANYPGLVEKFSIGKTYENRDIWMIKISDNASNDELNEPEVLYMGLQHANEAVSGSSMIFFMQFLCENYNSDQRIKTLVDNREIFIVPCMNPDGWEYNLTTSPSGGGAWRKNRYKITGSDYGIDLNRNWGIDWANCSSPILGSTTNCGSSDKSSDIYYGASAFSEAETQAIKSFVESHHIVAAFDQHAYGSFYSQPFGRRSLHTTDMPVKGQNFYTAVPALMGKYNGKRTTDNYDAFGYEIAGQFSDWMMIGDIGSGTKDTVWAMAGESPAGGISGFWAPASEIERLCKGMCFQNLQLAYAAGTYVDIQDASDIAVNALSGNFDFTLKRLGLGNDPVTVSIDPVENIAAVGSPVTVSSMAYYDDYNGSISYTLPAGIVDGHQVKFILKVTTGGYSYSDTITKIYNPIVLFSDNMEGSFSDNWQNTASSISSGLGYNYTSDNWDFTSSGGYNSSKALSESAAGLDYSSSSISISQIRNPLDLSSSTLTYLSFWTRHEAENFRDKLQVQASTDGNTWVSLQGKTTVKEPGTTDGSTINGIPALTGVRDYWTREFFDLNAFNGAQELYLRFVFTSDNDPVVHSISTADGFYIDNVVVVQSKTMTALPVKFLEFTGVLRADKTVKLDWDVITDNEHDHFIVERSADGNIFQPLGQGPSAAPYYFIDTRPLKGSNYYRIRQVDKDGSSMLSKVIHIMVKNEISVNLYPNPVVDLLTLNVETEASEVVDIEITDMQGKTVHSSTRQLNPGNNEIKINMITYSSQIYLMRISAKNGGHIMVQKLVKL